MRKGDATDPKGLMQDAFSMEGISLPECRSIFLDWALCLPVDSDTSAAIRAVMARFDAPDHPMTQVLTEGLQTMAAPRRRGGRGARQLN